MMSNERALSPNSKGGGITDPGVTSTGGKKYFDPYQYNAEHRHDPEYLRNHFKSPSRKSPYQEMMKRGASPSPSRSQRSLFSPSSAQQQHRGVMSPKSPDKATPGETDCSVCQEDETPGIALKAVKDKWTELGPLKLEEILKNSEIQIDQALKFG